MATASLDQREQVWKRLQGVTDPELDESVVDLQFVTRADIDDDGNVAIDFRLPTYWCAANFSFLMADDMRSAVASLPFVKNVKVHLGEHMYADKINAGLSQGLSFQDTFGDEADGNLDELRQSFLVKAFQRRQMALLAHLAGVGFEAGQVVVMRLGELQSLPVSAAGGALVARYLERRDVIGNMEPGALAFLTAEGEKLKAESLSAYVTGLRRVGVNAEFNSALCRGLLAVRFDLETPLATQTAAAARRAASC